MRFRSLVPPLLWIASIAYTSNRWISSKSFTASASEAVGVKLADFNRFWDVWWWLFVKGYHFGEFALLFWLTRRCLDKGFGLPRSAATGWAVAASAIYAAVDEFHQTFIAYRGGKVSDVLIDCSGAIFASLVSWALLARADRALARAAG